MVSTATLAVALAVAAIAAVPAAGSAPGSTEHGVNRAKLALKAEAAIEARNGIELLKISRCGPAKKKKRLNFSKWICEWRAEGLWPGNLPYHCAGKAVWKRKKNTWRIDPCNNRLQPRVALSETPGPHPLFGFNDNWGSQPAQVLDLLDDTEAGIARMSIAWSAVEYKQGTYDWTGADRLYAKLLAMGIKPLWVAIDAPCWAQPEPGRCTAGHNQLRPAPAYYDEYARWAAAAAARYPESAGIEVWNEPNYPLFWGGWPDPDLYAKMLRLTADAIHSAAPGMKVISGGLSPHADTDKNAIGFSNFLTRLYELNAAQKADAIGIHPYPGVGPGEDYIEDVRVYLGKVQIVMRRNGDGDRPLWVTEFGASTSGDKAYSEESQAKAIPAFYDLFRRASGMNIPVAIVHSFVEPDMAGRETGFGLLNKDLSFKPAFCAMLAAREVAGVPSC